MVPGICVFPPGREPGLPDQVGAEYSGRLALDRDLARRGVELPPLGPVLRPVDAGGAAVSGQVAGEAAGGAAACLYHAGGAGGLGALRCGGAGPAGGVPGDPLRRRPAVGRCGRVPSPQLPAAAGDPDSGVHAPDEKSVGPAGGAGQVCPDPCPGAGGAGPVYGFAGGCQL